MAAANMGVTLERSEKASFARPMKRLVIVADNSLIVEAIRIGLRTTTEFNLVGYADPRKTSATTIIGAQPDVVLLDDMEHSERSVELARELVAENASLMIIVLSVDMDATWVDHVFNAGASVVISKATHPVAMATLLRETLQGHVFHKFASMRAGTTHESQPHMQEDLPLTTRELEILQLVAAGSTNGEVARKLWVTEQTVKFHLRNIYRKLDVANRTEASHFAHVNGLVGNASSAQRALSLAS
jgi:DNA-binding NarL/FixJ family response regulator